MIKIVCFCVVLTIVLEYTSSCFPSGEEVELVPTLAKLPVGRYGHAAVYDGEDAIYIIGGNEDSPAEGRVLKFSLATETVEPLGKFPNISSGVAVLVGPDILYFGGRNSIGQPQAAKPTSLIHNYSTITNTFSVLGQLPTDLTSMSLASDASNILYIFGGYYLNNPSELVVTDNIYRYDVRTGPETIQPVAKLPKATFLSSVVWDPNTEAAIVFGGRNVERKILQYNPSTGVKELNEYLPNDMDYGDAAYIGMGRGCSGAFLIGGHSSSLMWFNASDFTARKLHARNWPLSFFGTTAIYVVKFARVYLIGGRVTWDEDSPKSLDEIFYIEVDGDIKTTIASTTPSMATSHSSTAMSDSILTSTEDCSSTYDTSTGIAGEYPPVTNAETTALDAETTSESKTEGTPQSSTTNSMLMISLAFIGALVMTMLGFFVVSRVRTRRKHAHLVNVVHSRELGNEEPVMTSEEIREFEEGQPCMSDEKIDPYICDKNIAYLPYNRLFEMDSSEIHIDTTHILGSGRFGIVLRGTLASTGIFVAVKTLRPRNTSKIYTQSLLSELKILIYLGSHDHVVNLVGARTDQLNKGIVSLFVEFCPLGDLEKYLREHKDSFATTGKTEHRLNSTQTTYVQFTDFDMLLRNDLCTWTTQIASAMEYIAGKRVIHGDLAIRNVLLLRKDWAKITDFGLSKKLYDYSTRLKSDEDPLPWRSLAIESLTELSFSSQSDVWSFGVTLWEIFSLGDIPYSAGTTFSLDFIGRLREGLRLPKPDHASKRLYEIMLKCWNLKPNDRPNFTELREMLTEISLEFANPVHEIHLAEYTVTHALVYP